MFHYFSQVYAKRLWAIVTLQAHVRRFIQQKKYRKLKIESRARRQRDLEARELEKKHGKKKAREIADAHFHETLEDMERKAEEEERVKRAMLMSNIEK